MISTLFYTLKEFAHDLALPFTCRPSMRPNAVEELLDFDASAIHELLTSCEPLRTLFRFEPFGHNDNMYECIATSIEFPHLRFIIRISKGFYQYYIRVIGIIKYPYFSEEYNVLVHNELTHHQLNIDQLQLKNVLLLHYRKEWNKNPWARRRYAVWMASNQSPNPTHILYKLPSDVSRKIITYL